MEISLNNKVIVVTGGTKGLGRAIAINATKTGSKIVIGGRNNEDGQEVVSLIKKKYKGDAIFVRGCLKEVNNCKNLISAAIDNFGRIDGLVNYAGITSTSKILDTTEELFDSVFAINFKASFFCTKYAVKEMLKNGGSIIFIGSTHAYGGDIIRAAYGCSKGAMLTLSKHISKNYARFKIRSNFLNMGWSATPNEIRLYNSLGYSRDELDKKGSEVIPMGRLQVDEDFVPGVIYLLSDLSSHLTGTELNINEGFWPNYG